MSNLLTAALAWEEHGFSVIPLRGKRPALRNWESHQRQRATAETIEHWSRAGLLCNIGIVCGEISDNLVVMDLDGLEAVRAFHTTFPHLESYHVKTGSGKGEHIYFETDLLPHTVRAVGLNIGNIEVRADGHYVVAPPSTHPDTHKQYIGVGRQIARVTDLNDVLRWVESLRPRPTLTATSNEVKNPSYYGRAALNDECLKVRSANEGARNNQLYRSALKLGTLAQRGHLTESEVESALLNAAGNLTHDDGEAASLRTIRSGLNNARKNGSYGTRSSGQA